MAELTRGSIKHQRLERSEPSQRGSVWAEHHVRLPIVDQKVTELVGRRSRCT